MNGVRESASSSEDDGEKEGGAQEYTAETSAALSRLWTYPIFHGQVGALLFFF
jgi:hypothetical protein